MRRRIRRRMVEHASIRLKEFFMWTHWLVISIFNQSFVMIPKICLIIFWSISEIFRIVQRNFEWRLELRMRGLIIIQSIKQSDNGRRFLSNSSSKSFQFGHAGWKAAQRCVEFWYHAPQINSHNVQKISELILCYIINIEYLEMRMSKHLSAAP